MAVPKGLIFTGNPFGFAIIELSVIVWTRLVIYSLAITFERKIQRQFLRVGLGWLKSVTTAINE